MNRDFRSVAVKAGLVLVAWTVFGILSAMQVYVRDVSGRPGASFASVVNIVYFYWAWALTTPLLLRLARGIGGDALPRAQTLAGHLTLAAVILAVQPVLYAMMNAIAGLVPADAIPRASLDVFVRHLPGNVLTLGSIVAMWIAFTYYRATQQRLVQSSRVALRASQLEASLASARLDTLRTQLRPHFLFNTLNVISALVVKGDVSSATRAIARLGDLLRATLSTGADQTVPLDRELELTGHYLDIIQLRFSSRLVVHQLIDQAALNTAVPSLVLQPIVENAIQHGVAARDGAGTIWIEVRRTSAALEMTVRDDGPGFASTDEASFGVGLTNVRDRLAHLYGAAATLSVRNAEGGGATVSVRIAMASRD